MKKHFVISALFVMSAFAAGAQVSADEPGRVNDNAAGQEVLIKSIQDRPKKSGTTSNELQEAGNPADPKQQIPATDPEKEPIGDGQLRRAKDSLTPEN